MSDNDQNQGGDYKVGYGKPPKAHQFQPKHGKSKGPRRKRRVSLQAIVEAELLSLLPYNEGGKTRRLPKIQLIVKRLAHKALAGDEKAISTALVVARAHLPQPAEDEGEETGLSEAELVVMKSTLKMNALFAGVTSDE